MAEEQLSAAQRSKVRRLSQPKELAPDEEGGELNIIPFLDIIMNVLIFVLATVSVNFISMIDAPPPKQSARSVNRPNEAEQLQLTILIRKPGSDGGFVVLGKGGTFRYSDGACTLGGGASITIPGKELPSEQECRASHPRSDAKQCPESPLGYDYDALHKCVRSIKCGTTPGVCEGPFAGERAVTISATDGTWYQTLVNVIDAARGELIPAKDPGGSPKFEDNLFPDINFGVPSNQ